MVDFVLGLFLAGLLIRGWARGFVREALDLVGLVVGIWVAFRLSGPLGEFVSTRFEVSPEVAVIGAGIVLFLLFGITMSIAAHYLSKVMNLPGLTMVNRVGGAAVAAAWGVAILLLFINLARVMPLPDGWRAGVERATVTNVIAGRDAVPQQLFESFFADNDLTSLASIRSLFGTARLVPEGDEVLTIPAADGDDIRQLPNASAELLKLVNEFRAGEGLGALDPSDTFTMVAEERAEEMYQAGRVSRDHPPGRSLAVDLRRADIRVEVNGENLAIASSARAAFQAMLDSPSGRANLTTSAFDRVGISVVDGPTGRLVVIDFGG